MNTVTNNPNNPSKEKMKNGIIWVLSVALVVISWYAFYSQNKSTRTIQQKEVQISSLVGEKSQLQTSFDAALIRLDSVVSQNNTLQTQLTEKNDEIGKVKSEIRTILNKKDATQAELTKAKTLIASLNEKITGMEQEITRLTLANETLTAEKTQLITDKEKLTQDLTSTTAIKEELAGKVDVASTLNASNINITPLKVKSSGKQVVSSNAGKVDKLLVSFDVDNRIIQPGTTDVFVLVYGPDGKPLTNGETGTFSSREIGEMSFTAKLPVEMETSKKKNVEFSFAPGKFIEGNYKVQIWQNGFLIGEGNRALKKGGLFS
jgi:peptidoglycan hydrolase CwlO-like protein